MSTEPDPHATYITPMPRLERWQPVCEQCGNIGRGKHFFQDAVVVAERHREIQGFER